MSTQHQSALVDKAQFGYWSGGELTIHPEGRDAVVLNAELTAALRVFVMRCVPALSFSEHRLDETLGALPALGDARGNR